MRYSSSVLFIGLLVLASLALLLSSEAADAEIHIDGTWYVTEEGTVVSNETVVVNGSVRIRDGGSLRLDNCTLTFNGTATYPALLLVAWDSQLEAVNSVITGGNRRFRMLLRNDCLFIRTTLKNLEDTTTDGAIVIGYCTVTMKDCLIDDVDGEIFRMEGSLMAANVTVRKFDDTLLTIDHRDYITSISLVLEGCHIEGSTERNARPRLLHMVSTYDETLTVHVSIRNTTMTDLYRIGEVSIRSDHTVEFLGCSAFDARNGLFIWPTAGYIVIRDCWFQGRLPGGGMGLYLSATHAGDVEITNVTWSLFENAVDARVDGGHGDFTVALHDVTVDRCERGFVNQASQIGTELTLEVHRPTFEGSMPSEPFVAGMSGFIEVYPDSYLPPVGTCDETSAITAYWTLDLDGGTWKGDGEVAEGTAVLKDHRGAVVTRVDLTEPDKRTFVAWMITLQASTQLDRLFPSMRVAEHTFEGLEFDFWNDTTRRITLIDDVTPNISIQTPLNSSIHNVSDVLLTGKYQELGSGVESIQVLMDGGGWTDIVFDQFGNWSKDLTGLTEGHHVVRVRVVDRVGNNRTIGPRMFIVDTIAPPLDLENVPGLVNTSLLKVSGSTEPGANILVGGHPVTISVEGYIDLELRLIEGMNDITITVRDAAMNSNATTFHVVLDTVHPAMNIGSPVTGSWTTHDSVMVEGNVELDATVMIDNVLVDAPSGVIHHEVTLAEGTINIHIVATDAAGNVNEIIKILHVDWTPPSIVMEEPSEHHALKALRPIPGL